MINLTKHRFELAAQAIKSTGRKLEIALFEHEFATGSLDAVLEALSSYQNEDGGFGHALEPDLRCVDSSALATTVALQHLTRLQVGSSHPLVQQSIAYLLNTLDRSRMRWPIIPQEAAAAPRAIWWEPTSFLQEWGNPNAEIIGYFHHYRDLVPGDLLHELTELAIHYLNNECACTEMHEMLCYVRLNRALPADQQQRIAAKLDLFVENCVVRNAADRQGYGAYPLMVADSPTSPYYTKYEAVIPGDLDALIISQQTDGAWQVNWSWNRFEAEWEQAKVEWAGVITLDALKLLKQYDRLPA